MKIRAVCFTEHGKRILEKLAACNESFTIDCFAKYRGFESADGDGDLTDTKMRLVRLEGSLEEWVRDGFAGKEAVIFVSAMGIAVRSIADCVRDKLSDSPVLVIDDKGMFVIPILSGHMGGANELALKIAELIGAMPVITTSTDSGDCFAVDLFAKENNLHINNKDAIKKVSAKSIEGRAVSLSIKDYPPTEPVDVVVSDREVFSSGITLFTKEYAVGVGLKKGKSAEEIESLINEALQDAGIDLNLVGALATIDIKLEEEGLKAISRKNRIPLIGYDSSILQKAKGNFSSSEFVLNTVGVDNVCERAAVIATNQGELVVHKTARNGVTVAIAKKVRN